VIGNFVTILDDSIVPAGVNIPENTIYGGKPARFIRAASDMHEFEIQQYSRMIYENMYSAITDCIKHKAKLSKASKEQKVENKQPKELEENIA